MKELGVEERFAHVEDRKGMTAVTPSMLQS